MAEEGTLAINADVLKLAGAQASSVSTAEAYTNFYIKLAEGKLCEAARYNWVSNYASVSTIGKQILKCACAAFAAFNAVEYDSEGFTNIRYQNKLNTLWAQYQDVINLLQKDDKYKEFILSGVGVIS